MRTIVYDFSTSMKKPYHNSEETASQPCTIVINKLLVGERAVLCGKKTSHLHKKKTACKQSLPTYLHGICLHTVKCGITNN